VRLPSLSGDLLEHVDLEVPVGDHLLQAPVFLLDLSQPLDVGRFEGAEVLPSGVDRLAADPVRIGRPILQSGQDILSGNAGKRGRRGPRGFPHATTMTFRLQR
jgi:hypothetical protein